MTINNCFILLLFSLLVSINCIEVSPSILIIGSGPSGIAAATRLWKHNFTNLKILEAENYIGGRIKSLKFGDAYVDLGAQMCHGEKDNIVYNMVEQYNILKHTNLSIKLVYSNRQFIDEELRDDLVKFADSVRPSSTNLKIEENCYNISSVGECFTKEFNAKLVQTYRNDPDKLKIILDSIDWLESYIISDDSAFSSYDLSRRSAYKPCEGDLYLNWNGFGYKTILEVMLQQYPDPTQQLPVINNILLNKEVIKIIWSNSTAKNYVRCLDGTEYEADHIIFTASLGVLKDSHRKIFEPNLPDKKISAISSVGFGAIMEIIFHFPTTWWDPQDTYAFIWSAEDKAKILTEFGKGPIKNGRSWLTTSAGFMTAENNSNVLKAFFCGEMVPELEKESDDVLRDGCMYMFQKFLGGRYSVVQPDKIVKSTWYSNPHFRGTYSYDSVRSNSAENRFHEKLATPLNRENGNPSVLFAGEATHPYYFSTVHGAIETGYREADRIINLYAHK